MTPFDPPAKPIGVIESIAEGFEAVNGRLWLIVFPILLDVFLWLGPHLSIYPLAVSLIDTLNRWGAQQPGLFDQEALHLQNTYLLELAEEVNIFGFLSTIPLGLPSLMTAKQPLMTPAGEAMVWSLNNWLIFFVLFVGLSLIGLFLGVLYFGSIARQMIPDGYPLSSYLRHLAAGWLQLLLFALVILVILTILLVPYTYFVSWIALFIGQEWGIVVLTVGLGVILWTLFYFIFVPHGIILYGRSLLSSMWDSLRLIQWNLTSTIGLFALIYILYQGLHAVWLLPSEQSWLMLIGIIGNAYIITSLITATFLFYDDRHRWWQENRQWMRNQLAERQRRVDFIVKTRNRNRDESLDDYLDDDDDRENV